MASKRQRKKNELARVERNRDAKRNSIGRLIAEREGVEERIADLDQRDPELEVVRERVEAKLLAEREQYRELRKRIRKLRAVRSKLKRRAKRLRRQIRNLARPKVIDPGLSFRSLSRNSGLSRFVGHYTAGPVDDDDDEAVALIRTYHLAHLNHGWAGLGYAFNVTRDGSIVLGRPGWAVGAHTLGYNEGSVGIVVHGTTGDRPSKAQQRALRWLLKNAHTSKIPASHRAPAKLVGLTANVHKQLNPTACPDSFARMYLTKGRER